MMDENQSFEELLFQAREVGEDEDLYWDIVDVLQARGDRKTLKETFESTYGDALERQFAADVLGRFSESVPTYQANPAFKVEIVTRLLEMLSIENEVKIVVSLAAALGHYEEEPRIFEAFLQLANHSDCRIRWHVAVGLANYQKAQAIELLIQLTEDADELVRDWATFGLNGRVDIDSPAVRAAFVARLDDGDAHTRAEALYGLAELHDPRVVPAILREFEGSNGAPKLFDLVEDTPDYRLLPALCEMAQDAEYKGDAEELQAAIAACEAHCEESNEN